MNFYKNVGMKNYGMDVYDAPSRDEWASGAMALYGTWVKDMAAKGKPGQQALDALQSILKTLRK